MDTPEKRDKLAEMYIQKQEKYIYYILALNVAAIGFSITQIIDLKATCSLIPVGLAMILWSMSFFLGIQFILKSLSTIFENINTLDFDNPNHPKFLNREDSTLIVNLVLEKISEESSEKAGKYFKNQLFCFYAGSISMIVWVFLNVFQN